MHKKACLIVLDGWGISPSNDDESSSSDAIKTANTPTMNHLCKSFPFAQLAAHGLAVGLPTDDCMGNSEVGHLNIGAGRVVPQDSMRISMSISNGTFQSAFRKVIPMGFHGSLHLAGLLSDGKVHSSMDHLFAALEAAVELKIPRCFIHCFTDGRDSALRSDGKWIQELQDRIQELNSIGCISSIEIATICGRYWAMDRDKRWERTQVAFEAMRNSIGQVVIGERGDWKAVLEEKYCVGETDEFFKPIILSSCSSVDDDDFLLFWNFRSDRMRQLVQVFAQKTHVRIATMTKYSEEFNFPVLFPPEQVSFSLAEQISLQGLKQCHIGESEKYAHVTFFFNGRKEEPFAGEERILIPSPSHVATYDLKPEMSVHEVAQQVCLQLQKEEFAFVMCNFAPPDMVGHTGAWEATVKAIEETDKAIGKVLEEANRCGYALFVTADHGNAERMRDEQGNPHTAHTCSPVPFVMVMPSGGNMGNVCENENEDSPIEATQKKGALCDVAPTILRWMGLEVPSVMTGKVLFSFGNK